MTDDVFKIQLKEQKEQIRKIENSLNAQLKEQNTNIRGLISDVKNHTEQIIELSIVPIREDIKEIKENLREHIRRTELNEQHIKIIEDQYDNVYKRKNQHLLKLSILIPLILGFLTIITQIFLKIYFK